MGDSLKKQTLFGAALPVGRHGKSGSRAGVKITEYRDFSLLQLAFFPDQEIAAKTMVKRQFGLPALPDISGSSQTDGLLCLRAEIGKIWLVSEQPLGANLPASMKKYYPLDLSASKICLHLSGAQSGQLINRQSAIDLSCPDGRFMATSMHHVGVHILKMGAESYLLFLPSSFAESLAHGLFDIACQFGVQIARPLTWPENSLKIAE
ncbi:MAG: hypothetical protein ACPGAC_00890 [Candidatus Puniceispirillaceae bacterium]